MKTTGVSGIPKFGLLDFLGHPNVDSQVRTTFSREERHSTLESQPGASWSLETRLFIWRPSEGNNLQFVPIYGVWKT